MSTATTSDAERRALKIVSWTLCGEGRAREGGDAISSARHIVDRALVVDTAAAGTPPLFCFGGTPTEMRRWPWREDFAAARNAALLFADETGANWSMMLDSDETVCCADPAALRAWIAALDERVQVVLVRAADGSHCRERFFRHPVKYKFHGRTHEQYGPVMHGEQALAPPELITWDETPKSAEQIRAKLERDVAILTEERTELPGDGRALLYLGSSLLLLRRYEDAIEPLREAARAGGAGAPWACYLAAQAYVELRQYGDAIEACAAGLMLDPGMAELPWYASVAAYYAGRYAHAVAWARLAQVHPATSQAARERIGFFDPKALSWGPHDVEMHALRALGDHAGAAIAEARRNELLPK